jgi:hypothetical protein
MKPSTVGLVSPFVPEQSQGIRGVERKLAGGPLTSRTQSNVYATIARQQDRIYVVEHLLALLGSQPSVLFNRILYLGFVHVLLIAECHGFEV